MVSKLDRKPALSPKAVPLRADPKAVLAAKVPVKRQLVSRDELSSGKGRALRAAAEKNLGARPFSSTLVAEAKGAMRIGMMGVLQPTVAPSPVVKEATAKVDEAYRTGGAKAAADEIDRQIVNLNPADATAFYEAQKPTIDKILSQLEPLGKDDTCQAITSLSHAASHAGAAAVADLGGRFAKVIPDGKVGDFDDGFVSAISAGCSPDVALATSAALRALGKTKGANDIDVATMQGINEVQGKLKDSSKKKAELDARLAQDMATFGGTLSPEERKAYEAAFWEIPGHAKVKADCDNQSKQLNDAMALAGPMLESRAKAGDVEAAAVLLGSYEQLAKFPDSAQAAIAWVARLGTDAELFKTCSLANALQNGIDAGPSLEDRLTDGTMADATTALQTKLLADHADDPNAQAAVLAELKEIYGVYKDAKLFVKLGKEVGKFLADTEKVITDPRSIADIAKGWDSKSKFGKATAILSVVTGLYKTGKQLGDGDYLAAAQTALKTVDGGLGLTAGILAAYSGAASKAANAAEFIDKFSPVIGAVVDAIQLGQDVSELIHDPNAGEIIKAVGTLVSLVGDAIPVLGGVLKVGGGVIHLIGGLIDSFIEGNEKKDKLTKEQVELYVKATAGSDPAITAETAKELVKTHTSTIERLTALGFTPTQIRELALQDKVKLSSEEARVAIRTASLFGLDPTETAEFLKLTIGDGKFQYDGPLTDLAILLFSPAFGTKEGDVLYQQHNLGPLQQEALSRLEIDNPELAAFLKAHQGKANYDTVFPDGAYTEN